MLYFVVTQLKCNLQTWEFIYNKLNCVLSEDKGSDIHYIISVGNRFTKMRIHQHS